MSIRFKLSLGLLIPVLLAAAVLRADVVTDWNNAALAAIKVDRIPPPKAARALAILHVSIYDAVNGITRTHEPYFVTDKPAGVASVEAAASAAAHRVLIALFPAGQPQFDELHAAILNGIPEGPLKRAGLSWGESVAEAILDFRGGDHFDAVVPYTPTPGVGFWVPTPPAFAPALLPQWPMVTPFAMTSGDQFRPPPPPTLDSATWIRDYNFTKDLGSVSSTVRSDEQTSIARFWADGAGTVTPPGHWNVIAQDVAGEQGTTLEENARLFALLNIAEADAAIIAWDCKYKFEFWRPVTAIRNGDLDPPVETEKDANWTPLLVTPPFPEYTSGHSTFSAAAATVLAFFFGGDIPFTTESDDLPGVVRSFSSFTAAAQEAGISRIYGGIHFLSANEAALASGERLGGYVSDNFLRDRPGRSHRGK
jgi:membrane-associated phospholipid phosphatase